MFYEGFNKINKSFNIRRVTKLSISTLSSFYSQKSILSPILPPWILYNEISYVFYSSSSIFNFSCSLNSITYYYYSMVYSCACAVISINSTWIIIKGTTNSKSWGYRLVFEKFSYILYDRRNRIVSIYL